MLLLLPAQPLPELRTLRAGAARGGLVPFIVLDAEKAEYCRAIRTFEDDGGERFVRFAEHMAELYLEEYSSLIPQNLLLPPLEEYVKHPSFDESDLSFFE